MKLAFSILLSASVLAVSSASIFAQSGKITIILLRHAEKDTSPSADKHDPDLTLQGKLRAKRLVEIVRKYQPDLIYSTFYKRARLTVMPLAETLYSQYRIPIRSYNLDELEAFADELLKSNARAIVVVGHNNTTPELANLLLKQTKYKELDDSEYDKIWIIKIKRYKRKPYKIEEKVIRY